MVRKKLLVAFVLVIVACAVGVGAFSWLLLHRTPGEYFDSNGVPIYYTVEGRGEPVILVHGVAANADLNWRRPGVTSLLARDFQVISFDLRGHGRSGQPTEPSRYGMELIEDIVRLMDHLHIEKAHVAGYSLGGFIVLKLITTHPDRIRSAAICAAGWSDTTDPSELPSPYSVPVPPGEKKARMPEVAGASVLPLPAATEKTIFNRLRSWVGDRIVNKAALKALKKSYATVRISEERLKENKVPSICLIGRQDGFYYLAQALRERMANMEYECIEGANHFTAPFYGAFKSSLHDFFMRHRTTVSP
jgi:pimeloyl-ACP methyl ester carboxylesterase